MDILQNSFIGSRKIFFCVEILNLRKNLEIFNIGCINVSYNCIEVSYIFSKI